MKHIGTHVLRVLALALGLLAGSQAALSAERTVALNVKMGCASCPYMVKTTLQNVAGVLDVKVLYEEQRAVVRFDDARTGVAALTKATADIGFPSTVASTIH